MYETQLFPEALSCRGIRHAEWRPVSGDQTRVSSKRPTIIVSNEP